MTTFHMHLEVRSAINWPKSQLKGMFRNKQSGKLLTPEQVRNHLMDELAAGHEVIPCGACDNFDYGKEGGCLGHES